MSKCRFCWNVMVSIYRSIPIGLTVYRTFHGFKDRFMRIGTHFYSNRRLVYFLTMMQRLVARKARWNAFFSLPPRSCFPRGKPFLSRCSLNLLTVPLRRFYVYLMLVPRHPRIYTRNFVTSYAAQRLKEKECTVESWMPRFAISPPPHRVSFFFYSPGMLLAVKYAATLVT